jgi:YebC/PmpR family DNA-binding regulatory protein
MAGHSHAANIKHKKAAIDAKRGKLWSKLSKAIIVAAKMGGGDADMNPRLRQAVLDAKAVSMPKDNIERAIKKGTGELEGGDVEEIIYEGFGAGGVAVMCDIMTDNRNRTAPEIRKIFEVCGGNLGATNSVGWMFERKGQFLFAVGDADEELLTMAALEAGAEDVRRDGDTFQVLCEPSVYTNVRDGLERANLQPISSGLARIPTTTVTVDDFDAARRVMRLMELLDDHDDVQSVSANYQIPDNIAAAVAAEA